MVDAVIVAGARTALAKSWKGAFNNTHSATMVGHALMGALNRAGIEAKELDDVIVGCAFPEGANGRNIARQIALRAGSPVAVPGMTINRYCSSGLQAIALAAQRVITGELDIVAAGGVESISCVQNEMNKHMLNDPWILQHKPDVYMPMLQTAEIVARRYQISRERQDEYGVRSQTLAAAAQAKGIFDAEIIPVTTTMLVTDKETGTVSEREVTIQADEGIRAGTTLEAVAKIKPAIPDGVISAGNASQFSDGAAMSIVMNARLAEQRGLPVLGYFRGFAVAGCEPDEMGIGPVYSVPKLLQKAGLKIRILVYGSSMKLLRFKFCTAQTLWVFL